MNAAELLELAKKATPGKWYSQKATIYCEEGEDHPGGAVASCQLNKFWNKKNARYIAALSPDKMIPLLERYLELEEKLSSEVGVEHKSLRTNAPPEPGCIFDGETWRNI